MKRIVMTAALLISVAVSGLSQDKVVQKVLELGSTDNQVMELEDFLTNRIGGRPIGSHALEDAEKWAADQFKSWGLDVMVQEVGEINVGFRRGAWALSELWQKLVQLMETKFK